MQFKCPKCSGVVSMDAANLGKTVSCGHCNEIVQAPVSRFDSGVIIDDFLIEREVGVGGMGVVYLARQMSLDRPVALKILKEKYASDAEFIVQFIREARSAAKLNHPNIVQAYAVGEEEGIFFFAMEFIDGETMKDMLLRDKKIDPSRAAAITRDIANALDYAWTESKIVHHDIKPDNIMLTKNGKSKLADLGLASMFGDSEIDDDGDEVLGTPQYISPEQLLGEPTDVRSDIYSLGATLYHFVTGAFPYNGNTPTEIAHQHVNGVLKPPVELLPELPQKLNDIILKMMAREVNDRYQTAAELAGDLQSFLTGPVETASAPIAPVSSASGRISMPDGGTRLTFGDGGKFPPAPKVKAVDPASQKKAEPAKMQSNTAAASKSSASAVSADKKPATQISASKPVLKPSGKTSSVSVPKVNLSAPSKAVPKIVPSAAVPKLNTVSSGPKVAGTASVPKINISGSANVSVPELKSAAPTSGTPAAGASAPSLKPASAPVLKKVEETPAAAAPVLKKAEPSVPEIKKSEPSAEKVQVKQEEKSGKTKKGIKKEKVTAKAKSSNSASSQMPKWLVFVIIFVCFVITAGGGITFYMYKNEWKLPPWEKFKAWNAKRKEIAKRVVRRAPPVQRKVLTIEELRKDYVPEINKLRKFIADNPSSGKAFLTKVEDFINENGRPKLENEKAPFNSLIDTYNEIDEKVWLAPARITAINAHQAEINRRIKAEKDRLAEEARIAAARKLEADKRIAFQKAEAERRRKEAEDTRIRNQKQNEYRAKIAPVYPMLTKLFYEAISNEDKAREFKEKTATLFTVYKPEGIHMALHQKLEEYAKRLQAELPRAQKVYRFMTESERPFVRHIVVLPRLGQVEILHFNFKENRAKVMSVISQRVSNISLQEEAMRNKFFALFRRRMPKVKELEYIEFFYQLFFGDKDAAKSAVMPAPVWREFFNYYR